MANYNYTGAGTDPTDWIDPTNWDANNGQYPGGTDGNDTCFITGVGSNTTGNPVVLPAGLPQGDSLDITVVCQATVPINGLLVVANRARCHDVMVLAPGYGSAGSGAWVTAAGAWTVNSLTLGDPGTPSNHYITVSVTGALTAAAVTVFAGAMQSGGGYPDATLTVGTGSSIGTLTLTGGIGGSNGAGGAAAFTGTGTLHLTALTVLAGSADPQTAGGQGGTAAFQCDTLTMDDGGWWSFRGGDGANNDDGGAASGTITSVTGHFALTAVGGTGTAVTFDGSSSPGIGGAVSDLTFALAAGGGLTAVTLTGGNGGAAGYSSYAGMVVPGGWGGAVAVTATQTGGDTAQFIALTAANGTAGAQAWNGSDFVPGGTGGYVSMTTPVMTATSVVIDTATGQVIPTWTVPEGSTLVNCTVDLHGNPPPAAFPAVTGTGTRHLTVQGGALPLQWIDGSGATLALTLSGSADVTLLYYNSVTVDCATACSISMTCSQYLASNVTALGTLEARAGCSIVEAQGGVGTNAATLRKLTVHIHGTVFADSPASGATEMQLVDTNSVMQGRYSSGLAKVYNTFASGPDPAAVAAAIWSRAGRSLTG